MTWAAVEAVIDKADSIAFDGCHKIYLLMDEKQTAQMDGFGYERLITTSGWDKDKLLETLKGWYEDSCSLRFIQAVETVEGDANLGFTNLISQFEDEEEMEDHP